LAVTSIYHDHLSFCFDHPNLSSVECDAADEKGLHRERDQDILSFMVINMLEAAYFQYREQGTKFRAAQWSGWNAYMELWVRHPEFGKRFPDSVEMFDTEFGEHIRTLYAKATKAKELEIHSIVSAAPNPAGKPSRSEPDPKNEKKS
jgi:hypothetical protein